MSAAKWYRRRRGKRNKRFDRWLFRNGLPATSPHQTITFLSGELVEDSLTPIVEALLKNEKELTAAWQEDKFLR